MPAIPFNDLDALRRLVSSEFGPWSEPVVITQSMIDAFAEMTGDLQWIHVDVDRATRESPFGSTIAHGFLTLGMATIIKNSADLAIVGHGTALNYGIDGLRFVSPVPAGAAIHGRTRIAGVAEKKGGTELTVAVAIHVVGAQAPALVFDWKLLYLP